MKYQIDYSKKNKMISMCSLLLLLLVLFCIIYEFNMNSDREIKLEDMTIKMNEHVMKNGEVSGVLERNDLLTEAQVIEVMI